MWETPIYKFKTSIDSKLTDIKIDVTGSAPNFTEPGKQLESTFSVLLKDLNPKNTHILDFGAAKLRNTIYLLKKGYHIYPCEYEDLFKRSQQARSFEEEAKKYSNYHPLIFPKDFINTNVKFDVILMINVLNIMPIALERLFVLQHCKNKIKENGKFLWYTQHGAYDLNKYPKLFDGIITGKEREYKMFYKDFSKTEIHQILSSTGFEFNKDYKFPGSGSSNQAYLFNPTGSILLNNTLREIKKDLSKSTFIQIIRKTSKTKYKTKEPIKSKKKNEIKEINILDKYFYELSQIKPGRKDAKKYEDLIFNILKNIFEPQLRNGEVQVSHHKRLGIIDIIFDNKAVSGFFHDLKENNIKSLYIFIECKNYTEDPKNPEINQLSSRLSDKRGLFGFLICRKITNKNDFNDRTIKELHDGNKYIIGLDDNDLKIIIKLKLDKKEEEINNFLSNKLKKLLLEQ